MTLISGQDPVPVATLQDCSDWKCDHGISQSCSLCEQTIHSIKPDAGLITLEIVKSKPPTGVLNLTEILKKEQRNTRIVKPPRYYYFYGNNYWWECFIFPSQFYATRSLNTNISSQNLTTRTRSCIMSVWQLSFIPKILYTFLNCSPVLCINGIACV